MITIQGVNNVDTMQRMYAAVDRGLESEARGAKTKNLMNVAIILDPSQPIITSFKVRKFSLLYAKQEWLWYLGADPKDDSIEKYATMWAKLKQPDGTFFSNYGQYIFGKDSGDNSPFGYVMKTLLNDPDSRRASIVLLDRDHLFADNKDTVCTYAINFTICQNTLCITVMMRSNDVIFGFTNDAFCFWQLYMFMYTVLKVEMPDLQHGTYTHFTNSLHVYDRHYEMIKALASDRTMKAYDKIDVPWPTVEEVVALVKTKGKGGKGEYVSWIKTK